MCKISFNNESSYQLPGCLKLTVPICSIRWEGDLQIIDAQVQGPSNSNTMEKDENEKLQLKLYYCLSFTQVLQVCYTCMAT